MSDMINTPTRPAPQRGFFVQMVAFLCSAYLVGMVAYLGLRLLFGGATGWLALLNAFTVYTFFPAFGLIVLAFFTGLWRDVVRLGLVCLLAVVWFGPFFQPQQGASAGNGTQIRVVTFNLLGNRNGDLATSLAWLVAQDADIYLIQERPARLADEIPELAESHPYLHDYGNGRLTLSRYPIDEVDGDRLVLDVNGQFVALYNVHFPVPFDNAPHLPLFENLPYIDLAVRYDESARNERIHAFLDSLHDEELPVIIGGDFNTSQHSIIYSDLALAMTDTFRETNSGLGATWPASFPLIRIDYIWYHGAIRALSSQIGANLGSDHRPYSATLEILPVTQ